MPLAVRDIANPLALLDSARPSSLGGNILRVEGAWDDWHWGLERTFRKELERSWRVFERHEGASFSRVRALDDARRVFAALKQLQSARIGELGLPYTLDDPVQDAFYDRLVEQGLERGDVVLTALTAGDEIVAALLGVAQCDHYSMVRLGAAQGAWKNCSPGRLIIERTMKALHAEGFRAFDFTIGDYPYKRRLGAVGQPLVEIEKALSLSGAPRVALAKAKRAIRARPALANLARRLRAAK
jgi:CelD/BcsL family acetyltransferase involved in cellulose biosynthesis